MARKKLTEEEKQTKVREFKTELDKVFIIILVLFIACGVGYAGYTMYKNGGIKFISSKKDKKDKEEKEETKNVEVKVDGISRYINDYVFVYDDGNNLSHLYNKNGELVYDFKDEDTSDMRYNYYDLKGNYYLIEVNWGEGETNNVVIHSVADGKDKVVMELEGNKSFFTPLVKVGKPNKLVGFVETIREEKYTHKIHYLDGKTVDIGTYSIRGVGPKISVDEDYNLYDERYAVVSDSSLKEAKYGVLDLTTGELVVGLNYNLLHQTQDGLYIAKMDGKLGLIDLKTKKVLPYEYDFIESLEDYYVVSKDGKLAILDENYRAVTDFSFDYQKLDKNDAYIYDVCCGEFNTFVSKKIGDKYLLVINYNSLYAADELNKSYDKEEAYIISKDGEYETVSEIDFGGNDEFTYFLDADRRNVHIYNDKLEHLYDISLKEYDFKADSLTVEKYGDDLLVLKADGTTLYFDYKTGEETDSKVATYAGGLFKYDLGENTVTFKDSKLEEFKFTGNGYIYKINEKSYFISDNGRFVIVK